MKLAEVIEELKKFGFVEEHIRQGLAQGDSVFNAWEAMKNALMIRWDGMNQMESTEKLSELKPIYDRLMGLKFKEGSAKTIKGERAKEEQKKRMFFDRLQQRAEEGRKQNQETFSRVLYDELRRRGKDPNEVL